MDAKKDPEVINKMVMDRIREFIKENYESVRQLAIAMDKTTSTVSSILKRNSLPSGDFLLNLKMLHPEFDLNTLYDGIVGESQSVRVNRSDISASDLIKFLKNNEIKLSVSLRQ